MYRLCGGEHSRPLPSAHVAAPPNISPVFGGEIVIAWAIGPALQVLAVWSHMPRPGNFPAILCTEILRVDIVNRAAVDDDHTMRLPLFFLLVVVGVIQSQVVLLF